MALARSLSALIQNGVYPSGSFRIPQYYKLHNIEEHCIYSRKCLKKVLYCMVSTPNKALRVAVETLEMSGEAARIPRLREIPQLREIPRFRRSLLSAPPPKLYFARAYNTASYAG